LTYAEGVTCLSPVEVSTLLKTNHRISSVGLPVGGLISSHMFLLEMVCQGSLLNMSAGSGDGASALTDDVNRILKVVTDRYELSAKGFITDKKTLDIELKKGPATLGPTIKSIADGLLSLGRLLRPVRSGIGMSNQQCWIPKDTPQPLFGIHSKHYDLYEAIFCPPC
jgi:hypothetical protein